eukprot:CFRG8340T1
MSVRNKSRKGDDEPTRKNIKLPKSLLEGVENVNADRATGSTHGLAAAKKKNMPTVASRKALRKSLKSTKKENARLHHIRNKTAHGQKVMRTAILVAQEKEREKLEKEFEKEKKEQKKLRAAVEVGADAGAVKKRERRVMWDLPEDKIKAKKAKINQKPATVSIEESDDEDEKMMKAMAKNLGFTHGHELPKDFAADGLDWIMNGGGSDDEGGESEDFDDENKQSEDRRGDQDYDNAQGKEGADYIESEDGDQDEDEEVPVHAERQSVNVKKNDPNANFFQMLSDQKLVSLTGDGVKVKKGKKKNGQGTHDPDSEDEDDRMIREMEKKLGLRSEKNSKLPTKFKEEGLAWLMYGSDNEDDFIDSIHGEESASSQDEGEEIGDGQSDDEENEEGTRSDESALENENGVESASEVEEGDSDEAGTDDNADDDVAVSANAGPEKSKYIPPHLRKKTQNASLALVQRQVKGQLNRLNDTTFTTIVNAMEKLYSVSARRDMHDTITEQIIDALTTEGRHVDRLLVTYGAFVTAIHGVVGIEFGACFIAALVEKFETCYSKRDNAKDNQPMTKEPSNLISILAYLYLFKVISHRLVFDYLSIFVATFTEFDIELVLLVLKIVGRNLREDDPALLKELILSVHEKARVTDTADKTENKGARVRFMIEMINDLKNNRMRSSTNDENAHLITTLKASVRAVNKTRDNDNGGLNTLTVGRDDLLNAHEKGRWWLVGSAWTGRGDVPSSGNSVLDINDTTSNPAALETRKLLAVARAQRMNTDVRRAVFCVVMGSVDYLDAFQKLLKLNLKDKQEREIVRVIVDCCMQEKIFNPYYAHLSAKFCHFNYNFKFTFQYTFWDRFKDMENLTPRAMLNLSRLLVHLFTDHSLSLAILKVVTFTNLDIYSVNFFRMVFTKLLLDNDEATVRAIFKRLTTVQGIEHLKEGINVFLSHFVSKTTKDVEKRALLKKRIGLVKTTMRETSINMM